MDHRAKTAEIEDAAGRVRRAADLRAVPEGLLGTSAFEVVVLTQSATRVGQDRAQAVPLRDGYLLAVADGAGGTTGGAEAAQFVVDYLRELDSGDVDCVEVLRAIDSRLASDPAAGETTAVIAVVRDDRVTGASVGDSGAWLILPEGFVDLTENQHRKPLLGTGAAVPVSFGPRARQGRLLLASDGLFKYVDSRRICDVVRASSVSTAVGALVDAARLPGGGLQDDVAVILAG